MIYWTATILIALSATAAASAERVQTSDKVCRTAIKQFAISHGINVNALTPPCYMAPCSYEGISLDVNRRNFKKLNRYLAASPNTRTCSRTFDVIKAGPRSDRRIP